MKSIAFALDPDGYWVEIIGQNPVEKTEGVTTTDTGSYRMVYTKKATSTPKLPPFPMPFSV